MPPGWKRIDELFFDRRKRLADELRAEQENATLLERERKLLEVQVKDSSGRLSEVFVKSVTWSSTLKETKQKSNNFSLLYSPPVINYHQVEVTALKGGRKALNKLETRIR